MSLLKRLVSEAHRRSLWQVLSVYLVGSWVALQVVESLTESAGLPDWVPAFALVLLIIGLPIVMATAFVQEGMPSGSPASPGHRAPDHATNGALDPHLALDDGVSGAGGAEGPPDRGNLAPGTGSLDLPSTRAGFLERHLTWKRAILGGAAAFTLLGVSVAAYFVMWSTGVGPVGSLAAQGVFAQREPVVLADFGNATPDSALSTVVTEALRIDLLESPAITVVEPSYVDGVLERMERDPGTRLTPELAREVAIREGIKAVLHGDVAAVGSGFVLTARLAETSGDRTLAAFRETATGPDELIGAIDKLSQRIREKAGESLRSIKGGEPLERYTTSSLEALRKYAQAEREEALGDVDAAIVHLEDALALDSTFAMAWRKLGVHFLNENRDPARAREAITRAHELRERLTPRERHLTTALYHDVVTGDQSRAIQAYENVLESHPDDGTALNNLGRAYLIQGDLERAAEYLRRAVDGPGWSLTAQGNLVQALYDLGRVEDARAELDRAIKANPEVPALRGLRARYLAYAGRYDAADSILSALAEASGADLTARRTALRDRAVVATYAGRAGAARETLLDVSREFAQTGPEHTALRQLLDAALIRLVLLADTAGALEEAERALARHPLEGIEPLNRPLLKLAGLFAEAGAAHRSRRFLETYDREIAPAVQEPIAVRLRRAVGGLVALAEDRPEEALEALTEVRRAFGCARCFLPPVGRAHEAAGRPEAAVAAYEEHLSGHETTGFFESALHEPWTRERLGQLYEELGQPERAAQHYRAFAERWADADPALQPRVRVARARAAEPVDSSPPR